jgi:hypothetical protein
MINDNSSYLVNFNFKFNKDNWCVKYDRRRFYSIKQIGGFRFTWNFDDKKAELEDNNDCSIMFGDGFQYQLLTDPYTDDYVSGETNTKENSSIYDIFVYLANAYENFHVDEHEHIQLEDFKVFMIDFRKSIAAAKAQRFRKFGERVKCLYNAEDRDCELITKVILNLI